MTVDLYRTAIDRLEECGENIYMRFPAPIESINELETRLGVSLPKSYKSMLSEFGILMFFGQTIYGIGKSGLDTKGGSGVLFQTEVARSRGQITQSMVRIMSSGYGPEFCIDCSELNSDGEASIYLVPADGNRKNSEKIADSFGEFLLSEVELNIR